MKEITIELECVLDESELNDRGQSMSTAMLRYDEVEAAKKEASKDFSEEMKALRGRMRELSKNIRRKSEFRPVVCVVRFHVPELGMKRIMRSDTGEIVRDEVMTFEERQNNLFDDVKELDKLYGGEDPRPDKDGPPALQS
jgi:hypothetical protein